MAEFKVGQTTERGGKTVLLVRYVESEAFFEDLSTKECYLLREKYFETLDEAGEVGFIQIDEQKEFVTKDPAIKIKGPDTLEWRKVQGI